LIGEGKVPSSTGGRRAGQCDKIYKIFMDSQKKPSHEHRSSLIQDSDQARLFAANLVEEQRASLLSRIHRLLGDDARRVTDTDDILSTALRRIDSVIERGDLEAENERQFYAFVHGVIERTILEKGRKSRGLTAREKVAHEMRSKLPAQRAEQRIIAADELNRIGQLITDPIDREIILLKGRGSSFVEIAESMDMMPDAVRKRWSRIRTSVRKQIKRGTAK
jgi:RNA polymerase sigma factor (sigma-70 family)